MTDISKFPFFGGEKCHKMTESFSTFAAPKLDTEICRLDPHLAALWKRFNYVMNRQLVKLEKLLDKKDYEKMGPDKKKRLEDLFDAGMKDQQAMQKYCDEIIKDTALFLKTRGFKRSTVVAFAIDG